MRPLLRTVQHAGVLEDLLLVMFGAEAMAAMRSMPPGAIEAAFDAFLAIPDEAIRTKGTLPSFVDLDGRVHTGRWLSAPHIDAYFAGLQAGLYPNRLKRLLKRISRWTTRLK